MPPKKKTPMNAFPTTNEELAAVIAQAIAQHEANRSDVSGGTHGSGRGRGSDGKRFVLVTIR